MYANFFSVPGEAGLSITAVNGREAIERAPRRRILTLDIMTPEMDGYEFRAASLTTRGLRRGRGKRCRTGVGIGAMTRNQAFPDAAIRPRMRLCWPG
jgi:CheY-like chemotaxis protein